MAALIVLLPISAAPSSLAHRPGHIVPLSRMAQYHSTITVWHDMIGRHCPTFSVNREIFSSWTRKFSVPWLFVINPKSSEVPMTEMHMRYSGADLFGVTAKVVDMPNRYVELHADIRKKLGSATMAQTYSCQTHLGRAVGDNVASGFYALFVSGFVMETVAERTIPAGGVAKVE